ncbi:MAG: YerC/YecD family TrpR-related protein [Betaproteobacteria bacterium]
MVNEKLRCSETDRLFTAILSLRNQDECYRFFEDLCTVAELKELSQRFEVAELLAQGETYQGIVARTGASTATVSRVKRALEYGADGYKLVLARLAGNRTTGRAEPGKAEKAEKAGKRA